MIDDEKSNNGDDSYLPCVLPNSPYNIANIVVSLASPITNNSLITLKAHMKQWPFKF